MRDLLLLLFLAASLLAVARYPFAGLLLWAWFTLATPHMAAYWLGDYSLNSIIAAATLASFLFHGEFWRARLSGLAWLILLFTCWLIVSQLNSLAPDWSAEPFDRFLKIMAFIFLCSISIGDRLRFHALLWILVLVMGFYGAKGGMFTLLTLGQIHYFGLPETILYDNNHIGIAIVSALPLFFYLAGQVAHRPVRWGLWIVCTLSIIAIIGTQSRGAFIAAAVLAGIYWWRSKRKLLLSLLAIVMAGMAIPILPDAYTGRMASIATAPQDESFTGRVEAWEINWKLARENPLTGAGLRVPYNQDIADQVADHDARAAHSIYFEILGGMGFAGLAIYLAMLGYGFLGTLNVERRSTYDRTEGWQIPFTRQARASLIAFAIGGASVSMEMWEGYLIVLALIGALERMSAPQAMVPNLTVKERIRRLARRL